MYQTARIIHYNIHLYMITSLVMSTTEVSISSRLNFQFDLNCSCFRIIVSIFFAVLCACIWPRVNNIL